MTSYESTVRGMYRNAEIILLPRSFCNCQCGSRWVRNIIPRGSTFTIDITTGTFHKGWRTDFLFLSRLLSSECRRLFYQSRKWLFSRCFRFLGLLRVLLHVYRMSATSTCHVYYFFLTIAKMSRSGPVDKSRTSLTLLVSTTEHFRTLACSFLEYRQPVIFYVV